MRPSSIAGGERDVLGVFGVGMVLVSGCPWRRDVFGVHFPSLVVLAGLGDGLHCLLWEVPVMW